MSRPWPTRLAKANCLIVLFTLAVSLILDVTGAQDTNTSAVKHVSEVVLMLTVVGSLAVIGALIIPRHPRNLLGPLMSVVALLIAIAGLADAYATRGLGATPEWPAALYVAWLSYWLWVPSLFPLLTFLLLLCPDGRLPSPRWRPVVWLTMAALLEYSLQLATEPGPMTDFISARYPAGPDNPLGLESPPALIRSLLGLSFELLVPAIALCATAVIVRFRHARGQERQQLKWFASAAAAAALLFIFSAVVDIFSPGDWVWDFTFPLMTMLLPAATGIAILRYRLYDIDRIINRTLVYGALTAGLAATYFGLVVGLQALLSPLSGGSDLAIVLTTLVVAGLFLPARRRLQDVVDRRFNRRAYDAARTVEAFSTRLSQQIDLDTLRYELLAVVDETMAPVRTALWLRAPEGSP